MPQQLPSSWLQRLRKAAIRTTVATAISLGILEVATELPSKGRASWFYHCLADQYGTPFLRTFVGPEMAHNVAIQMAQYGLTPFHRPNAAEQYVNVKQTLFTNNNHNVNVMELKFSNPIGLAAGFDKDGTIVGAMMDLGFAFTEIGTVTPQPQPGNPMPRMFRLPEHKAIINRYGFNSVGSQQVLCNLQQQQKQKQQATGRTTLFERIWYTLYPERPAMTVVGINLGKNKDTDLDHAVDDYVTGIRVLGPVADYLVLNISSPNTPGLRDLQQPTQDLKKFLQACIQARNDIWQQQPEAQQQPEQDATRSSTTTTTQSQQQPTQTLPQAQQQQQQQQQHQEQKESKSSTKLQREQQQTQSRPVPPLLVKLAPDLTDDELDHIALVCLDVGMDGIVTTNTTNQRPLDLLSSSTSKEEGGLSGEPLKERSTHVIRQLFKTTQGQIPIIGVGGVFNGQDAYEKLKAGASLVQIYSSMVYQGPGTVSRMRQELAHILRSNGQKSINEVIGRDHDEWYWKHQQELHEQEEMKSRAMEAVMEEL